LNGSLTISIIGPNCGVLIRNANAFLASAIYLCGSKNWDRRTAVGANHYENIRFSPDMESVIERHLGAYRIVAIENNIEGAKSLPNYQWHKNSLILFGNETTGLGENILSYADDIITIPQWGSVRSLNVGSTSAIVCYDYCEKMRAEAPQGAVTSK
jgi:tRNA G18 (ribose-2'-O)-methylase SpoU